VQIGIHNVQIGDYNVQIGFRVDLAMSRSKDSIVELALRRLRATAGHGASNTLQRTIVLVVKRGLSTKELFANHELMIIQRMSTHRKNECFFSQLFN
jgi:hypothetical protein